MTSQPDLPIVRLFDIDLHAVTHARAVEEILGWIRERDGRLRFVVTPNVQHAIIHQRNEDLRRAYLAASLVVADGMPLVWSSRLFGQALPERVAGSDIVPALFARATEAQPLDVYLLGGPPGVGERAASVIMSKHAHVRVVGTDAPALGFERDEQANHAIVERINRVRPDLLLVGLGCPKQELWTERWAPALDARVALCVGGTIGFLAGEQPRAPRWMRRIGVEWVHRMASEPSRLGPRYASDALNFPRLLFRQWRASRGARG